MIKILFKISIFILFVCATGINLNASEKDSLRSSLSSEKILLLKTLWSGSDNAAGLWSFDLRNRIGQASLNLHHIDGDYHRFQEEQTQNKYGFYTKGYAILKHWRFYGDFNYFGRGDENAKWEDVLETYNDNPYTLGDKNQTKYSKEFFNMRGKGAWHVNENLNLGFDIIYQTGVGARRKDPRPENKSTNFTIKPGIIYRTGKLDFGLNFNFQTAKEDITFENVTDSLYTYYHFKGLGAFTSSQEEDDRSHEATTIGGGFQFGYRGNKISNLTEINFYQKETDIKRGETFPLQVVLLEKFQTNVASTIMFSTSLKKINKLKFHFTDKHIYGHEPIVEPKLEQVTYQWSTLAKYTLYWHNEQKFGVNYSHYKLTDANHFDWGTTVSANVITSESSYHFVPEKNEQELNYLDLNVNLEKEFVTEPADIVLSLNGGIQKGFNSTLEIVEDEMLLESINTDFVQQDFDYFNERLVQFGGEIQIGKIVNLYQSSPQLFLTARFNRIVSQMHDETKRNSLTIKLGINF